MSPRLGAIELATVLALVVGGLNWGAVAAFDLDVVSHLLGERSVATRAVQGLIAVAALSGIALCMRRSAAP